MRPVAWRDAVIVKPNGPPNHSGIRVVWNEMNFHLPSILRATWVA
jgi:hypothetical protein